MIEFVKGKHQNLLQCWIAPPYILVAAVSHFIPTNHQLADVDKPTSALEALRICNCTPQNVWHTVNTAEATRPSQKQHNMR